MLVYRERQEILCCMDFCSSNPVYGCCHWLCTSFYCSFMVLLLLLEFLPPQLPPTPLNCWVWAIGKGSIFEAEKIIVQAGIMFSRRDWVLQSRKVHSVSSPHYNGQILKSQIQSHPFVDDHLIRTEGSKSLRPIHLNGKVITVYSLQL